MREPEIEQTHEQSSAIEAVDETDVTAQPVVSRVASAIEGAVGAAVQKTEGAVGAAVQKTEGAVGAAVHRTGAVFHATTRRWDERPGARVRRLRRLARSALPYLYDLHPEARQASPRELGVMSIPVDEIAGTAVGGATQRGADFLPLKPFRSVNWSSRWQRLRAAADRLAILPPVDVVRYADRYWVLDGHNRVGLALYGGQIEIDANVVELVAPGASLSLRPASLANTMQEGSDLRTALSRRSIDDEPIEPIPGDPEPGGPPGTEGS